LSTLDGLVALVVLLYELSVGVPLGDSGESLTFGPLAHRVQLVIVPIFPLDDEVEPEPQRHCDHNREKLQVANVVVEHIVGEA